MYTADRVLIAEGIDTLRRKLYGSLLQRDIFSDCVSDGTSAIQQLEQRRYAVVLLDFSMPEASEVLDRVRTLVCDARPVVLALLRDDQTHLGNLDLVQVVLRKPFNADHIADIVDSCLRAMSARARRRAVDAAEDARESTRPR